MKRVPKRPLQDMLRSKDWVKRQDALTSYDVRISDIIKRWRYLSPGEKLLVAARADCPLTHIAKLTRWKKNMKFDVDINAPVKLWASRRLKSERKRRKAGP